jgi:hypothetical protein
VASATKEESKKHLKELQEFWYKKLQETGFQDIENTSLPEPALVNFDSFKFRKSSHLIEEQKLAYYQKATELLDTYPFESELHKIIWSLHCQGFGKRRIEKAIAHIAVEYKTVNPKPYKREAIGIIVAVIQGSIK